MQESPLYLYFPGLTGGGVSLTEIREFMITKYGRENIFVPSSITTPEALKKGETQHSRLEKMANEIIAKRNGELRIISHSYGSYEALDLVRILIAKKYQGEIKVEFIGTPGLIDAGIKGLTRTINGIIDMGKNVTIYEQHIAYPFPDAYYENVQETDTKKVWVDSSESRAERRAVFIQRIRKMYPNNVADDIIKKLIEVDDKIVMLTSDDEKKAYFEKRISLLHQPLQDIFHGKHVDQVLKDAYARDFGETPEEIEGTFGFLIQTALYGAGVSFRMILGLARELQDIKTKTSKGEPTSVQFSYTLLERDAVQKKRIDSIDLSADLITFLGVFEQLAHSSVGYFPKPLESLFAVLGKPQGTK